MWRALLAISVLLGVAARAEENWVRLSSQHFEVLTDAGAATGRNVLRRFEQIRGMLLKTTQVDGLPARPVRIFVFRSENEFAAYKDPGRKATAGFYRADRDHDFIAMENTGVDMYRVVFHEYVHLVLHYTGIHLPLWLNEGTAELFSTMEITGSHIRIGETIPPHIQALRREKMIDLLTLMQVDQKSEFYNEDHKAGIFYAESWAFAHMLNLSPQYAPGWQRFLELTLTGTPQTEAFERVYGRSTGEVFRDLRDYINGDRFATALFKAVPLEAIRTSPPKQLTRSESGLALAGLLTDLGKAQQAERKLRTLAAGHPDTAAIEEALGDTALADGRQNDALAHYQRAIDLGTTNARVYFEQAALMRENHGDLKQAMQALQRALEIDPNYSKARDLLASMQFTSQSTDRPGTPSETRASARVPKTWHNLTGDRRMDGKLVQLDCMGKAARFHILAGAQQIALYVDDPSKVVLTNAAGASVEFACGTIQPRDVVVEYVAKPNTELKTAGEITAIQFK